MAVVCTVTATQAGEALLQSGPMAGYAEMREVALWVQTTQAARVQFVYRDTAEPERRYFTEEVETTRQFAFTATVIADSVQPGRTYHYDVLINGDKVARPYPTMFRTPELWHWRSDPPDFSFAAGSCSFINEARYDRPGKPYGGGYEIFGSIQRKQPDFMLWLGDNVYLREADWYSRSGILHRYTHTRSLAEMQSLLGACSHYAIWDDHDFGPNNADASFRAKEHTLEAFRLFWPNPALATQAGAGITTTFEWADCAFFLLDNRWNRTANRRKTGERQMLGAAQIEWLISALVSSDATFKFIAVGGQVLNPVARWENYAIFPEERSLLLKRIEQEGISGVMFLSGDRHHSDISKMNRPGTYPLYECTVSPLTSGTYGKSNEPNYFRLPDTSVGERNFAVLRISGPRDERVLRISVYNTQGVELLSYSIEAAALR